MTRVVRIAGVGLLAALLVLVGGWFARRGILGADEADARARIEQIVRASFADMEKDLRARALALDDPDTVGRSSTGDLEASRRLFTIAGNSVVGSDADRALTVYAPDGRPLAWGGRPSDVPAERLQGVEAWFFAQDAFGLRLVYALPITPGRGRIGTIVAQRSLPSVDESSTLPQSASEAAAFQFPTRIAPVSIRLPFEDLGAPRPGDFVVTDPSGATLLIGSVDAADISRGRARWQRATTSLALTVVALTILLLAGPALDRRASARTVIDYGVSAALVATAIVAARIILRAASFADWSAAPLVSSAAYASSVLRPYLSSPFDFLTTAMTAGGLVALALMTLEAWRIQAWSHRRSTMTSARLAGYVAAQVVAGAVMAALLLAHAGLLRDTIDHTTLDLLHFSLHPWSGARAALQIGLIAGHATVVALGVLILRAAAMPWRVSRRDWQLRLLTWVCWIAPLAAWQSLRGTGAGEQLPLLAAAAIVIALATFATRLKARFRHGSQAFRLTLLTLGLIIPAIAFYPTLFQLAWQAKSQLIETRYAPEARNQRATVLKELNDTLEQIDTFPGLADLIRARSAERAAVSADRAYQVWKGTALAEYPITSSVELYGADGMLVSRFSFNLPDDLSATPPSEETSCDWNLFEEVAPFFGKRAGVFHAGRAICGPDPDRQRFGSISVHAMIDYENLPFISSENPYLELLRPSDPFHGEGVSGGDVEFAFYGWSRTPLFSSRETAWHLDDAVFDRQFASRQAAFWTTLWRGSERYDVYLQNNRGGIYALGFPVVSFVGHLLNLAEITLLAIIAYTLLLAGNAVFGWLARRRTSAPALLREIRASFYRKLFVYIVLAVFFPVLALAVVTRYYVAQQLRSNVEEEALRTVSAAKRVVENLIAPRFSQSGLGLDDNLMVWVSHLIDQDVNIFVGPRLTATSERNLFASSLLPTRTPADVYRALELENEAATVTREQIAALEYLVASAKVRTAQQDALLTVPLTSRQQDIDAQIDTLDRRVLLGALLFIMAGAGLGYSMAERISDPVNRLTRATRRIARGDLDARITTASADELGRLVEDFNKMAADLQRQRTELERTHRLEAWAEMARQVAHEIKNPLTPIQLNAEHLRRVHADRGEPLSPILEQCVETILTQVRLLRQIASEFSSFASAPTARVSRVDIAEMLREIVDPYRAGLEDRIRIVVDIPASLPAVAIDRTLIARSLTNIVENALHAMPGKGTLTVQARESDGVVRVRVSDTGVGMDEEALARAFEPYFSTKATGTGLGLPIAKRNVELIGGSIAVESERDKGTAVELALPVAADVL